MTGKTGAGAEDLRFGHGFLTDIWHVAALSSELKPGAPIRREILGEPLLLARPREGTRDGGLLALRDICPHRAAPLSAGRLVAEPDGATSVECPYHGWRFGADGRCRAIPSLTPGQSVETGRISAAAFPVAERQGLVFVWIPGPGQTRPEPLPELPVFPGLTARGRRIVESAIFESHMDHAVVGLMDPAHGPYVHRQWWWRPAGSAHAKSKAFGPVEAGFSMLPHRPSSNSLAYRLLGGAPRTEIVFRLPGLRYEHVRVGARELVSLTCLTPISERRTRVVQILWSDHPVFALARPLVRAAARRFLAQDAAMVTLQNINLPHDPGFIWIDDADRQARWYQALKREWAASRREGRPFVNPVAPTTLSWTS
ncbi:MAG: aromatic ring-hydroxylating dioxygenase subunit alpha [Alphaproteobacteria bacterium]|nr:aromatic ring-hydroxylating dioxygenase subunit alpha [Alphaproteobacteria bacterium]